MALDQAMQDIQEHTSSIPNCDVVFNIQKHKDHGPEPKYRSFKVALGDDNKIQIGNKRIRSIHLYDLLKNYGLPDDIPMVINCDPFEFAYIDWNPMNLPEREVMAYGNVYFFEWNGIRCGITGSVYDICFRIYDIRPGVGELVMKEIISKLSEYWTNEIPEKFINIFVSAITPSGPRWNSLGSRLGRNMNTIYINKDIKNKLYCQLENFMNASAMYDKYGINWKRIYLFHGPPGTGKTSTIFALASMFGRHIAKLTVTAGLTSANLESLFQTLPEKTFMIMEDVDALFAGRKSETSIDFSTVLNCMDGITTKRGLVLFMTTNHVLELDNAFIRPCRIDTSLEFKLPTRSDLEDALNVLAPAFAHEHAKYLELNKNISIAHLQKHIFDCILEEKNTII